MTVVSISQPTYLPYAGFFHKMIHSDIFVFLDDVQYEIRGFHNRNRIKTPQGIAWLTVPLSHPYKKLLNQVVISDVSDWSSTHKNMIKNCYRDSKFFDQYWSDVDKILTTPWINLLSLNIEFIEYFKKILHIDTKIILSSELNIQKHGTEKLVSICNHLNGTTYLSGIMGKNYLQKELFTNSKIHLTYQNFKHPIYNQLYGEFVPNLSILDLLFNEGPNAKDVLN